MSYTPTEWESTDVVTATRMNALEQAVGDMNMSYTPNTWSDGDILSAEKMNALEQAVASGGGGSSDFSTAQVTITDNTTQGQNINVPWVLDVQDMQASNGVLGTSGSGSVDSYDIILYKGKCVLILGNPSYTVTTSGSIEGVSNDTYLITGDCTITIS